MTPLTIAVAQSLSVAGDVATNLARHLVFMRQAAEQGVQLLVFPELSLTGYEPSLVADLAIAPEDVVLGPLREMAQRLRLTAVVGMPVRQGAQVLIGALVLASDGSVALYTKQHLHPGEEAVFAPGWGADALVCGADQIALAVCADFSHSTHPREAAARGANLYAASVLVSEGGYDRDSQLLKGYAAEHRMVVLMANHGGPSGGWACAGRSAIWGADGHLIAQAPGTGDRLVVARRDTQGNWRGEVTEV